MSNSETITIEKLAAAISKEVYIDIAKWHLYLNDAKLAVPLAQKFYPLLNETKELINTQAVKEVLASTKIEIGGGQKEIALTDLIPSQVQSKLLDVLVDFTER